jgi:hypothetical protein
MGYRKRTVQAGGSIEIRKSYCPWDGERRKKKEREPGGTPEAVKRENERRARETLRWLIAANFGVGDFHLTLTFRQQERPAEEEGLKREEYMAIYLSPYGDAWSKLFKAFDQKSAIKKAKREQYGEALLSVFKYNPEAVEPPTIITEGGEET